MAGSLGEPFTGAVRPGQGEFIKERFVQTLSDKGKQGRAAQFGARHGLITVVAGFGEQAKLLHVKAANGRRYFAGNGLQSDLAAANKILALELAQATANASRSRLKRPGVSTGRLYAALLAEGNRHSDQFGFGVGNPQFLDRSAAKYWRQIDQGFTGHLGRIITGVWGATLTGEYGGRSRYGPYPLAGPSFSGFGAGNQDRLRPMGRKYAYRLLRKQAGTRNKTALKGLGTQGVISKAISPERYFAAGWEEFNARRRVNEVVRQIVTDAFGGMGIPTSGEIRFRQGLAGSQPAPSRRFR